LPMHLEGKYILQTSRDKVWSFITTPEKIAGCLPDLQNLQVLDSKHFTVTMKVGIAFVRGTFKFDFTLLDQTPPSHSKFEAIGKGAGVSVKLTSNMDLQEISPTSTELAWKADAELGGLLGEISPSLIQNSTNKMTEQFFECVKTKLQP
jgi:carbon monoxide dehydrogenase subunit G